eukprot:1055733-Prorocentrum_minimum.AAC.2
MKREVIRERQRGVESVGGQAPCRPPSGCPLIRDIALKAAISLMTRQRRTVQRVDQGSHYERCLSPSASMLSCELVLNPTFDCQQGRDSPNMSR